LLDLIGDLRRRACEYPVSTTAGEPLDQLPNR